MNGAELAKQLAEVSEHPDRQVVVWTFDAEGQPTLAPIAEVTVEQFNPNGPWVIVLNPDARNTAVDALSNWLDGDGELPVARPDAYGTA